MLRLLVSFMCFTFFLLPKGNGQVIAMSEDLYLKNDIAYFLVGNYQDTFALFRDIDHKYKLHTYDNLMLPVDEIDFEFDFRKLKIIDVLNDGKGGFNIFYFGKKKGVIYLNAEKYNIQGERLDSTTLVVYKDLIDFPQYKIELSDDESKMLLYEINSKTEMDAVVIDNKNFELIWQKVFNNNDFDFYYDFEQILISNASQIFIISNKKKFTTKKVNPYFHIHYLPDNVDQFESIKIPFVEYRNYSSKFVFDNLNNKLTGAGLYANRKLFKAMGYFFISIPMNDKTNHSMVTRPFSRDFIMEYLNRKKINKKAGIIDTEIKEIVLRKDGGALLIGEKVKLKEKVNGSRIDSEMFRADFFYEEIFMASIHPDGEEHWKNIIHKRQYSFDDSGIFSSFYLLKTAQNLNVIFNDDIRSQSTVSQFTIQGNGKYKRKAILNTGDIEVKLRVKDALQISSNQIVVPSQYKNKLRLVKFTF